MSWRRRPWLALWLIPAGFIAAVAAHADDMAAPVTMPAMTWVARPLPERGHGPCPAGYGCKHMRLAHNPVNGRIYFLGGDYAGPGAYDSGRNELYSYSIATGDWRLEYPYCGFPGDVMPGRPDEVGWVWDSKRQRFWMIPGGLFVASYGRGGCTGAAEQVSEVMTFDPETRKWALADVDRLDRRGEEGPKTSVYDPVTDQIVSFRYSGGMGNVADVLDLGTGRWHLVSFSSGIFGRDLSRVRVGADYMAIDPAGRAIYAITPDYQLIRFRLDRRRRSLGARPPGYASLSTGVVEVLAHPPAPDRPVGSKSYWNFLIPVWDSVNRVLLFPHIENLSASTVSLLVYHPDKNAWERDGMFQPDGVTVRGNSAVFDPRQNVLLLIGGLDPGGDYDRALRHFFLYRYRERAASASPDRAPR